MVTRPAVCVITMLFTQKKNVVIILVALMLSMQGRCLAQQASVLASGNWYKIAITQQGIYQITGKAIKAQGINLTQVHPEQIQLYGYGGGMLPQSLAEPRYNDLPENAIEVVGGEDGKFDEQDYVLFYGQPPDQAGYRKEEDTYQFQYQKNLYSDTAFYFLTFGQAKGKRMAVAEDVAASDVLAAYDDYAVHELDMANVLKDNASEPGSGREWYGETVDNGQSLSLDFALNNLSENADINLQVDVLGKSLTPSDFEVSLNKQSLGKISVSTITAGTYSDKGSAASGQFTLNSQQVPAADQQLTVRLTYRGGSDAAYLNRVWLTAPRLLKLYGNQTFFRSLQSVQQPATRFHIRESGASRVWDITDPQNVKNQSFVENNGTVEFGTATAGPLKEFVVFNNQSFLQPEWRGAVANQDIKAGPVPDMVIVSYPGFVAEAERLAQFRQQHDHLQVRVVTTQQVYNEFSSGAQDLTAIRNYMKYLYAQEAGRLKYLLLFGKGSYDYKNRVDNNTNFVPIYESRNSTHPIYSYASDDYFGFLEDTEGYWEESQLGDHTLEIGTGRLPVKNLAEAKAVVDKLIYYGTRRETLGNWRNQVLFVADDGDNDKHQRDAERLAQPLDTAFGAFNIEKIYVDAYPQQQRPNGEVAPKVNEAIQNHIKKGALIVNYTGHGSEKEWAHENILNLNMIKGWSNIDKLPFFVTATCEFGRHDAPEVVSGAEHLVLNPKGGAIGMVTTARPVFSNSNFLLNRAFYQEVFRQVNGQYQTLGEIFKHTKNNGLNGPVNRNFSLLGDPSMTLSYPQDQVVMDSLWVVDTKGALMPTDTLKAMAHVQLKGSVIQRGSQTVNTSFNGTLYLTVYDKPTITKTRGNEETVMQFEERTSVLHRGKARISQGLFTLEFMIPKNIAYQYGSGKISAYAVAEETNPHDAHGATAAIQIGGTSETLPVEQDVPEIHLFMDDTTFRSGDVTTSNPVLIAHLKDESGINISYNGLGQNITATLEKEDGMRTDFVLNDFFMTNTGSYQAGTVTYPLENLEEGRYTLRLEAWDQVNQQHETSIVFLVQARERFAVSSFYNVPNPFQGHTYFTIDHNRPGDHLKVSIKILDLQGQLVHSIEQEATAAATRLSDISWDGRDAHGNMLRPGIYLARLVIRSQTDGAQKEKVQKIIVVN